MLHASSSERAEPKYCSRDTRFSVSDYRHFGLLVYGTSPFGVRSLPCRWTQQVTPKRWHVPRNYVASHLRTFTSARLLQLLCASCSHSCITHPTLTSSATYTHCSYFCFFLSSFHFLSTFSSSSSPFRLLPA